MENINIKKSDEFWFEHLKRAQEFGGTDFEYCQQNNLKSSTFSGHKKRLGFTKHPSPKRVKQTSFKKIIVSPQRPVISKTQNPEWVAKFLKEFLN